MIFSPTTEPCLIFWKEKHTTKYSLGVADAVLSSPYPEGMWHTWYWAPLGQHVLQPSSPSITGIWKIWHRGKKKPYMTRHDTAIFKRLVFSQLLRWKRWSRTTEKGEKSLLCAALSGIGRRCRKPPSMQAERAHKWCSTKGTSHYSTLLSTLETPFKAP